MGNIIIRAAAEIIETKLGDKYVKKEESVEIPSNDVLINDNEPIVVTARISHVKHIEEELPVATVKGIPYTVIPKEQKVEVDNNEEPEKIDHKPIKENKRKVFKFPNVTNLNKAVSKISNKIREYLIGEDLYTEINGCIGDKKLYADTFYLKLGNCIYHSLTKFCHIEFDDAKKVIKLPTEDTFPKDRIPVLVFFDRIWNDKRIYFEKDPNKILQTYRTYYTNCDGLMEGDWEELFLQMLKTKIPSLDEDGRQLCVMKVLEGWQGNNFDLDEEEDNSNEVVKDDIETLLDTLDDIEKTEDPEIEDHIVYNAPITVSHNAELIQDPNDDYDEDLDDNDDDENTEYDEDFYTKVEIHVNDISEVSIVRIRYWDSISEVCIPFNVKLHMIEVNKTESIVDNRNGVWDWLIHTIPDKMFYTQHPEKYLEMNDIDIEDEHLRFAILDKIQVKNEDPTYVVGIFAFEGVFLVNPDGTSELDMGDDFLSKINYLIQTQIATSDISSLTNTIENMKDLIISEESIIQMTEEYWADKEDEEDETSDDIEDETSSQEEPSDKEDEYVGPEQIERATRDAAEILVNLINAENPIKDANPVFETEEPIDITPEDAAFEISEAMRMDPEVVTIGDIGELKEIHEDEMSENYGREEPFIFKPMSRTQKKKFTDEPDITKEDSRSYPRERERESGRER